MLLSQENCQYIHADELIKEPDNYYLIDIREEQAFQQSHIAGAYNICAYETSFVDQVGNQTDSKDTALLLYGEGPPYKGPESALKKLMDAGDTRVFLLGGGLPAYRKSNGSLESTEGAEVDEKSRSYPLDVEKSVLRWTGRNLTNQHYGTLKIKNGLLELDSSGQPIGAEIEIDMQSIHCEDLKDHSMASALVTHLESIDFFDTEQFPVAGFKLRTAKRLDEKSSGHPNWKLEGEATIREVSLPISIEAMISKLSDGAHVVQTVFELNRVDFGTLYGSGRIFEKLGMHLVHDLISIDARLTFR